MKSFNRFKTLFKQLDHETEVYRNQINATNLTGEQLKEFLTKELAPYSKWRKSFMSELGAIGKTLNSEQKEFARKIVLSSKSCRYYQESPFCWQIVQRPAGYVGDAEMMEIIYRSEFEGSTPWGMLVHKEATTYTACQAVRNRKTYMLNRIKAAKESSHILSLAAGSVREIKEYLQNNPNTNKQFLALDHDINNIQNHNFPHPKLTYGLANAFHFIKNKPTYALPKMKLIHQLNPKIDLQGWRKYFAFLNYKFQKVKQNHFDLIYVSGLYDYIINYADQNKGAKKLTQFLFDKVKPKGQLVIGNFNNSIPDDNYFSMEFLTNWVLHYRTDQELLGFLNGIDSEKIGSFHIDREATGINSFLVVIKK